MIHVGPSVWRKFSGETRLVKRVQAFLWMNVSESEFMEPGDFLQEAQALIHLINKEQSNTLSRARRLQVRRAMALQRKKRIE